MSDTSYGSLYTASWPMLKKDTSTQKGIKIVGIVLGALMLAILAYIAAGMVFAMGVGVVSLALLYAVIWNLRKRIADLEICLYNQHLELRWFSKDKNVKLWRKEAHIYYDEIRRLRYNAGTGRLSIICNQYEKVQYGERGGDPLGDRRTQMCDSSVVGFYIEGSQVMKNEIYAAVSKYCSAKTSISGGKRHGHHYA